LVFFGQFICPLATCLISNTHFRIYFPILGAKLPIRENLFNKVQFLHCFFLIDKGLYSRTNKRLDSTVKIKLSKPTVVKSSGKFFNTIFRGREVRFG
jgi:hypothetical protein